MSALHTGDHILLFGEKTFELEIFDAHQKVPVVQKRGHILRIGLSPLTKNKQQILKNTLDAFYKNEAKHYISQRCDFFAEQIGVHYKNIFLKRQKSRWGS